MIQEKLPSIWVLSLALVSMSATPGWAVEHSKGQGEPYALAGKRLVFTNWIFVRTGQLDWVDARGETLYSKEVKAGPADVQFRAYMAPHGVRLIAEPAQRPEKPFIANDQPWEAMGIGVGTLLRDGDKYRLWAFCQDKDGVCHPCYYESSDGET